MPRARRAGTQQAGGGETAAAAGGELGREEIPPVTTQGAKKKLSEAVNRRLKSAVGVQNLTMSDGFQFAEQLDNITKSKSDEVHESRMVRSSNLSYFAEQTGVGA